MLVLTSNGISSEKLYIKVKQLMKKDTRMAALVTTASTFHEQKDRNIQRHTEILERLGLMVELFDFAEQSPTLLKKYDLIFLMGGNTFYLLDIMRKTKCKELFAKYIKDKVVIGASAGSIVFGSTVGHIYELEPEANELVGLTDFTGLALTNIHVFPHVSLLTKSFERCLERLNNFEKINNIKLTLIEDGQGVFVNEKNNIII
jgi:dipeptidase E